MIVRDIPEAYVPTVGAINSRVRPPIPASRTP